jgi:phospholipase/lecithinase/hemolysin
MSSLRLKLAALGAAVILAACGGGGAEGPGGKVAISSIKVMGDSLADSGTFGLKFTVQGTAGTGTGSTPIWTELAAANLGAPALCNFYQFTGVTFAAKPGCTSYAVGGGRINNPASGGGAASPVSIIKQLQDAGAAGSYAAGDLLLIDGGGNDAADLVGAYLKAASDGGAAYQAMLLTQLAPATVATTLGSGATGAATAGGLYMQALADTFYGAIKTNALDKGAKQVAVLNMPGVTNTPRFQMVLDSIAAASGGGTAGATARAQAEGLFKSWVETFNAQLAAKFAGDTRVTVVDFYTEFNNQISTPAQFALTNVKTPACPITGVGSDGLPTYTFATCSASALSAAPPAGTTDPNWWKSYAFSDGFHPTPYGHQLMSQLLSRSLAKAGWL